MKKASFLLLLLLTTIAGNVFADDNEARPKGINLTAIFFIIGLIVFLIVVRKLYERRNKNSGDKGQSKSSAMKENIYEPKYWYQCKNCKVTVRKDTPPNTADCFKAVDHVWTQIAEVGNTKFLCRNCSTMIEAKAQPINENCPDAPMHDWERLG